MWCFCRENRSSSAQATIWPSRRRAAAASPMVVRPSTYTAPPASRATGRDVSARLLDHLEDARGVPGEAEPLHRRAPGGRAHFHAEGFVSGEATQGLEPFRRGFHEEAIDSLLYHDGVRPLPAGHHRQSHGHVLDRLHEELPVVPGVVRHGEEAYGAGFHRHPP